MRRQQTVQLWNLGTSQYSQGPTPSTLMTNPPRCLRHEIRSSGNPYLPEKVPRLASGKRKLGNKELPEVLTGPDLPVGSRGTREVRIPSWPGYTAALTPYTSALSEMECWLPGDFKHLPGQRENQQRHRGRVPRVPLRFQEKRKLLPDSAMVNLGAHKENIYLSN